MRKQFFHIMRNRITGHFRSLNATQMQVRPLFFYSEEHLLRHVFLCMLASSLEWRLPHKLVPLLFEDSEEEAAAAQWASPVVSAEVSAAAKTASRRTPEGLPLRSLRTLPEHFGNAGPEPVDTDAGQSA